MPVPGSGELKLRADINQEINGNDTDTNVSLGTLSDDAGFDAPDKMSDFYGYSNVTLPVIVNTAISTNNPSGDIGARGLLNDAGGGTISDYGIYVGTSSSIGSATKYSKGSSWGVYSWKYPTQGGFSNNTSYYVWIYATNEAGEQSYSLGQITTPPAYVPVTHGSLFTSGDWAGPNYCPNNNFIGGLGVSYLNSTTSMVIEFYGDSNFTNCSSSYPNCITTYSTNTSSSWQSTGNQMFRTCCTDNSTCGNSRTGYAKYTASGYTDVTYSHTRACPSC